MERKVLTEEQKELIQKTVIEAIEEKFPNRGTEITTRLKHSIAQRCISVLDTIKREGILETEYSLRKEIDHQFETWHPTELKERIRECVMEALAQMDSIVIGNNGKPR